jgi:hypothetical protein
MPLGTQVAWLFILAIPVACAAWTVTHEEVFREPREFCVRQSRRGRYLLQRKFFYLFTCEYCFSHYVALVALWMTGYRLLMDGTRGFILAWFALVWIANLYMGVYGHLKVATKSERADLKLKEEELRE